MAFQAIITACFCAMLISINSYLAGWTALWDTLALYSVSGSILAFVFIFAEYQATERVK